MLLPMQISLLQAASFGSVEVVDFGGKNMVHFVSVIYQDKVK